MMCFASFRATMPVEHRLDAVVLVMTEGDGGEVAPPIVPKFTCCHFDREMVLLHIGKGVEVANLQGNAERGTERFAELLVAVRFGSTKVEVAMQCLALVAQCVQDVQQGYGVAPST